MIVLHMLPLESMPIFRDAEIDRISSIGLMFNTVDINKYPQKEGLCEGFITFDKHYEGNLPLES